MMHVFVSCGEWVLGANNGWSFAVDAEKRGRLIALEPNTTLGKLKTTVMEDYEISEKNYSVVLSFLPAEMINTAAPVIISNDRQLINFSAYVKKRESVQLCVTFAHTQKNKLNIGQQPCNSNAGEDVTPVESRKKNDKSEVHVGDGDDVDKTEGGTKMVRFSLVDALKKDQYFQSKKILKAAMEICAMKNNFDYKVVKSDKTFWCIRCADSLCNWSVCAVCLEGSSYFVINKYVADHTCGPSNKTKVGKTASAKTIGNLILHKYEGVNEGPKPRDVIQIMRTDHGCDISYSLAWDAREYAINVVRGIPEKSYEKIPKYLHMLKEANHGTHCQYEIDNDGRFRFLFISFGQSVRGFYKAIRKVIVVDGTFLKNKYKGVLLVATALDGNSNLYPIAFGIVDSENDRSWEWFLRQLQIVIADELGLAFISDRHGSIAKALSKVYPLASHGICIHHLLNNVVTFFKGKGLVGLVAKASKAYRVPDFQKLFTDICKISPAIGKYLIDADVRTWARCQFQGFRYDIRTTNPAESINSALRSPREFPVIPLLDSIREMLTRWFYQRKIQSSNHTHLLTDKVEKKIDRRIEKGKTFIVYPISCTRFHVVGDTIDCTVDLERRTCSCGKYDLLKIPCRHAIRAGFSVGKTPHSLTDELYKTTTWRSAYEETINPIAVPEDAWHVPLAVEEMEVFPSETRRAAGRRRKRRYETAEDKIRSSQGSQQGKRHKCSRCGFEGHNRARCDRAI